MLFRSKMPGDRFTTGPRKGLAAWTNHAARRHAGRYPFLASLGDDHVPRTPGWDAALVRAIREMGGTGFAYPHDGIREDIPEAVVMSSDIVRALGWMALPDCQHYYIDNAWADLGRQAGCIRLLRAVAVDHVHPSAGLAPADGLNAANAAKISPDRDAWLAWRATRMADDAAKIRALREARNQVPAGMPENLIPA